MAEGLPNWPSPYRERPQFIPLHNRRTRWFIAATHRRAGKTVAGINELIIYYPGIDALFAVVYVVCYTISGQIFSRRRHDSQHGPRVLRAAARARL